MKLYAHLTLTTSSTTLWLAEHPAVALLAHSPVYTDPIGGGGGTTGH